MKIAFIEPKPPFNAYYFLNKLPLLGNLYMARIQDKNGHEVRVFKETGRWKIQYKSQMKTSDPGDFETFGNTDFSDESPDTRACASTPKCGAEMKRILRHPDGTEGF